MRKMWDHTIKVKEEFILRKEKVYPLSREEREEVREFIKEQLYISDCQNHHRQY